MKKIYLTLIVSFLSLVLSSCILFPNKEGLSKEKYEIVSNKYGEVLYLNEQIMIYNNLKELFDFVEGIDYIIENSASRESVAPEIKKHFYLFVDIVMHEGEIKMLLYNNLMKKDADKNKMFILTRYNLPIRLEGLKEFFLNNGYIQDIKDFKINVLKKDKNLKHNLTNSDEISRAYYNKTYYSKVFMSMYDKKTGNVIVGDNYEGYFANVLDKVIFTPTGTDYSDVINEDYDTLNNEEVPYILDSITNDDYKDIDLEEYDLVSEEKNTEIQNKIFFTAFTYEELLLEFNQVKDENQFLYIGYFENGFNSLIETYDEEFFESNMLIYYYRLEDKVSVTSINSVTKENDTITLNVNRILTESSAMLSGNLNIVVIKKEDIEGINKVDVILRTIAHKSLMSSVTYGISNEYIRDFYINGYTMDDFKDVSNLKSIELYPWPLFVDLVFNKEITDDDLDIVLNYLYESPFLLAEGYKGKDFIRLKMNGSFYDKVMDKTLVVEDFILDEDLINDYLLTIDVKSLNPLGTITFYLTEPGKDNVISMIEELNKDKYPFLVNQDFPGYIFPVHDFGN